MLLSVGSLIIANMVGWAQRDEKSITETDRNVYYTNISLLCFLLLTLLVLTVHGFITRDSGYSEDLGYIGPVGSLGPLDNFGYTGNSSADNSGFAFG